MEIKKLTDNDLEKATGGYLQVSQWREYVTGLVTRITTQMAVADDNDKTILNGVYSAIMGTMIPGAAISDTVTTARSNYYASTRASIHSTSVRDLLDDILDGASDYLANHS